MANEYNLKCPKCGNDTKFAVTAYHVITIDGTFVDNDDSCAWESDDVMTCGACNHEGKAKSFNDDDRGELADFMAELFACYSADGQFNTITAPLGTIEIRDRARELGRKLGVPFDDDEGDE